MNFLQNLFNPSQSSTIANGGTTSGAIQCGGLTLSSIQIPATFTGTSISFTVSGSLAGTYAPLYDSTNTLVSITVQAGRSYAFDPNLFQGVQFVKVVSNATELGDRTLILSLKGYLFVSSTAASASGWFEQAKLIGTPSSSSDHQGASVAFSDDGNTLAIGAYGGDGGNGIVFVFTRSGTVWTFQQAITSGFAQANSLFGLSISLSADGNTLVVGQAQLAAAKAIFYARSAGVWSLVQVLSIGINAHFGYCVSLSADGNRAAIGNPGNFGAPNKGIVRIANQNAPGSWIVSTGLTPTGTTDARVGRWGVSLSADGTVLSAGGADDSSGIGAFFIWTFDGVSTWTQTAKVTPPVTSRNGGFASSISISKDGLTIAVGSPNDQDGDFNTIGGTVIYSVSAGVASQVAYLQGTGSLQPEDQVEQGLSVALNGDGTVLAVGGPNDNNGIGAVWIFKLVSGIWTQDQKIVPIDGSGPSPQFGQSVYLNYAGDTLALGAIDDTTGGSGTGATWVYIDV